ncbi:RHS repeat protein [Cobetia crustatorum]|uniref:RHS repeat protein n=1 Tax=Cobetia crustatorum TaxID=553385 RepID=A0A558HQG4_9GAMM|nr:RHS repeat protein [Cobetia crustatorum]
MQGAAGQGNSSAIKHRWQYADNGLLTATDDSLRGTTRYGYDALGRLRQVVSPLREEHFALDPAGNLVESDRQGADASDSTQATRVTAWITRLNRVYISISPMRLSCPLRWAICSNAMLARTITTTSMAI